ncbi:MAG TPA: rod shape-determining protein [Firmicutes bacterium]|nr:rod shape-determining protein [Bacillota bacterium]
MALDLFSNDIAIDLGTANTLICVKGKGIVLDEPSVVAVEKSSRKVIAVGREAKEMLGKTPEGVEAIRPLKDGVIADFEVTEIMLREFIRRVQGDRLFSKLVRPRVIISVPSGITEVEKRAVRDSAEHAGAREVFLIAEPIAAAIGVGLPIDKPAGNMVIDIGGGTTEIGVIALNGIVAVSSIRTAGDEMDEAIVRHIKEEKNTIIGEQTAERIKISVGFVETEPDETIEVRGIDLVSGVPKVVEIEKNEIVEALKAPVTEIKNALKLSLEKTPPELAADIVDKGILMTGGGSLLRGLDRYLSDETKLPIYVVDDPLKSVVLGAYKALEEPEKYENVLMKSRRIW